MLNSPTSVGFVQAALTESGDPRLVVTGTDNDGLLWSADAVSNPALIRDLKGDLAILDEPESITVYSIRQPEKVQAEEPAQAAEAGVKTVTPSWVIWVAGGVLLLSLFVLMFFAGVEIANRRKARNK